MNMALVALIQIKARLQRRFLLGICGRRPTALEQGHLHHADGARYIWQVNSAVAAANIHAA
jgi:hypothetical protein